MGYLGYLELCLGRKEDMFCVPWIRVPVDSSPTHVKIYTLTDICALMIDRFTSSWDVSIFRGLDLGTLTHLRTLRIP